MREIEALRNRISSLSGAAETVEELLQTVTFRLADGQEIALNEFPLAACLSNAAPLRAEEVVLSVRDGRTISILINVTPIAGRGGAVASVVVTMQDLRPLQELERERAEFLGMVSHELRAPLSSVKGLAATDGYAKEALLDRSDLNVARLNRQGGRDKWIRLQSC